MAQNMNREHHVELVEGLRPLQFLLAADGSLLSEMLGRAFCSRSVQTAFSLEGGKAAAPFLALEGEQKS